VEEDLDQPTNHGSAVEQHKKDVDAYNERVTRWGLPVLLLCAASCYLRMQANTSAGRSMMHFLLPADGGLVALVAGGIGSVLNSSSLPAQGVLAVVVVGAALGTSLFQKRGAGTGGGLAGKNKDL